MQNFRPFSALSLCYLNLSQFALLGRHVDPFLVLQMWSWHALTGKPSEMAGILLWLRELGRVRSKSQNSSVKPMRCEADPIRKQVLLCRSNGGRSIEIRHEWWKVGSRLYPVGQGLHFALLKSFQVLATSALRWGRLKSQANSDTFGIGTHIADARMKRLLWLLRWCPRNCCPVWCWKMLKPSWYIGNKGKRTQCCTLLLYSLVQVMPDASGPGLCPAKSPIWTPLWTCFILQVPLALVSTKLIKPRYNSLHFPTIMIWLRCSFLLDPARSKHIESMLVDCMKWVLFKSCFFFHWSATSSDADSNFKVE